MPGNVFSQCLPRGPSVNGFLFLLVFLIVFLEVDVYEARCSRFLTIGEMTARHKFGKLYPSEVRY